MCQTSEWQPGFLSSLVPSRAQRVSSRERVDFGHLTYTFHNAQIIMSERPNPRYKLLHNRALPGEPLVSNSSLSVSATGISWVHSLSQALCEMLKIIKMTKTRCLSSEYSVYGGTSSFLSRLSDTQDWCPALIVAGIKPPLRRVGYSGRRDHHPKGI